MLPIRRRLYQSLAGFTPRQLFSALQGAWLEPTPGYIWQENTGINPTTTGGQTIGKMADQSGGGNNGTQATAANRPTYQLDSNSLPLARHDATDSLVVSLPSINVRRSLLTWSESFDNAAWTTLNSTVNADVILAPNGSPTADKIKENTALGTHRITWSAGYTGSAGQVLTYSVYIKSAGRNHALISSNFSDRGEDRVVINLTTGAVSVPVGSVVSYASAPVNDGWWRVTVTQTKASSVQKTFWVGPAIGTGTTDNSYTGDGTSGIYIWGAQLELGSVASDYQKITDWTSEVYASSGSVYFATPVGMSALHNQSMGTTYTLPALSTDIYSWIVVPQRLSTVLEGRLERYMLRKANLPEPDYLLDDNGNQLMSDDYELLLRQ